MKNNISVIVPLYNEELSLKNTVIKLDNFLKKICNKYEIIIVDSASTDKSPEISDNLSKKYKNIKVIHQKTRKGFGNGLREGYRNSKLDLVWYMDADLPHDVIELNKALFFVEDYDAIIGYKIGKRASFARWFLSLCYNNLIKTLFRLKVKDVNYSFKLLKKKVLDKLDLKSDGWFIDAEILIELRKGKYKIKEVPIPYVLRKTGKSTVVNYPKVIYGFLKEIWQYLRK